MSKSAENVAPAQAIDPVKLEASIARRNHELLNNESWRQATNVGLTALGAGAGLRGLHGLLSVISRNLSKPPAIPAVATMEVPVHGQPVKKRKKTADAEDWKYLATEPFKRLGNLVYDAGSAAVKGTGDAMAGTYATEPQGLPEHWLRTFGMGVGGGLGGYKLVDWLLDKRRKAMVDKDVEDSRQEYENLLYGKNASAIDELFSTVKQAFGLGDLPGALTGGYLTYALGSPLVTGTMAYNKAKKLRRKNLIDAAQKMRLRQRLESSPIPIFALPADTDKAAADQEEETDTHPAATDILRTDRPLDIAADYLTSGLWGGERAGRAQAMATASGDKAPFTVRHPLTTDVLHGLGGAVAGGGVGISIGAALDRIFGSTANGDTSSGIGSPWLMVPAALGSQLGGLAGGLYSAHKRRAEIADIVKKYDAVRHQGKLKVKPPRYSALAAVLAPLRGPHRRGQLEATRAMNNNQSLTAKPRSLRLADVAYGAALHPVAALPATLYRWGQNAHTQFADPYKRVSGKPDAWPKARKSDAGPETDKPESEKSSSDEAASMEAPKPSSLEGLPGEKTKTTGESSVGSAGNASGVGATNNFGAREQGLAALLASLAGAGFGVARKPGGSRARGAVIGGTAGLGGMAGLLGANAFMRSPLAEYLRETGLQAPVILGGTGLGLAAGLRGGRGLADLVGLKGRKNNNPDNDLEELDIATKTPKWLS